MTKTKEQALEDMPEIIYAIGEHSGGLSMSWSTLPDGIKYIRSDLIYTRFPKSKDKIEALQAVNVSLDYYSEQPHPIIVVERKHIETIRQTLSQAPEWNFDFDVVPEGQYILATWLNDGNTGGQMAVIAFYDDEWRDYDRTQYHDPDAWQPLPPAPKSEE